MSLLSLEDLRSELRRFAETAIHGQLSKFSAEIQESLRSELKTIVANGQELSGRDGFSSRDKLRSLASASASGSKLWSLPGQALETSTLKVPEFGDPVPDMVDLGHPLEPAPGTNPAVANADQFAASELLRRPSSREENDSIVRVGSIMEHEKQKVALLRTAIPTAPVVADALGDFGYFQSTRAKTLNLSAVQDEGSAKEGDMKAASTTHQSAKATMLRGSDAIVVADTPSGDYQGLPETPISEFIESNVFDHFVLLMIFSNAVFIGIETSMVAQDKDAGKAWPFQVLSIFFLVVFSVELSLRIFVYRRWFFRTKTPAGRKNPNFFWNVFDSVIVGIQLVEYSISVFIDLENSMIGKISALRLLRMLRIGRLFRMGKLLRWFRTLRTIVYSISHSWSLFLWAVVSLAVLTYLFAVYITELVSAELHSENCDPLLKEHFGSVYRSWLSVGKAATGGIDWGDVYTPLDDVSFWFAALPFLFCLLFLLIVVMNVFTGVFLDSATQRAQQENEIHLLKNAYTIFKAGDINDSGTISKEDFQESLSHPEISQFFQTIDLDVQQAEVLFELLDMSNDGFISCDEFLRGCLRLRGTAKALDLLILSREVTQLFEGIAKVNRENAEVARVQREMLVKVGLETHRILKKFCPEELQQSSSSLTDFSEK